MRTISKKFKDFFEGMDYDTNGVCWELIENCSVWNDILEECKRFDKWKPHNPLTIEEEGHPNLSIKLQKFAKDGFNGRWLTKPTKEDFPTFFNWYDKRFGDYEPEIRRLDAGAVILPHLHNHVKEKKYLYNMSINHPKGCKFGIKGGGIIPYKNGDVMKINVHKEHCVWNNSSENRYHVILGVLD